MRIFVIPSWYPTADAPHTGIFIKEQALALAGHNQKVKVGISTWGTHNNDLLLEKRQLHLWPGKLLRGIALKPSSHSYSSNCTEYFTPAFTWSRHVMSGNMEGIIRANEANLGLFKATFGRPDIIHAHTAYPAGFVAQKLSEKHGIPYVITEQMSPFPFVTFERRGQLHPVIMEPYQQSGKNIAVSAALLKTMEARGVPHLKLINNLTDEDFFQPDDANPSRSNGFCFAFIGRMEEQKGVKYLLEAAKLLKASGLSFKLVMGGDGAQRKLYELQARGFGLADQIEWLGTLDRQGVRSTLQHCNAFVLPSIHENHPLVLLEALAMGKPAIATYCGGAEEIVKPATGYLVEPGNPTLLAEAMTKMMNEMERFDAEKIRKSFMERFSKQVIINQLMDTYEEVIASQRATI